MRWESLTEDRLDPMLVGRSRDGQMASRELAVGEKKTRESHQADGYRSIVDWPGARQITLRRLQPI